MKVTGILTRERSEEEKLRRHLYGDKGAKFSGGKIPKMIHGLVIEISESDKSTKEIDKKNDKRRKI